MTRKKRKKKQNFSCPVKKNQILTVTIEDLSYQGQGVAKIEGYPLFISNALPGESCRVKVVKILKNYGFGRVEKRLTDSPDRVPLRDEDGLRTGTMPLQHLAYPAQLDFKRRQVQSALEKAGLKEVVVLPVLGMENPWRYRNKAQVPIGGEPGHLYSGFYRQRSHDLIPVTDYQIQLPEIDATIQQVLEVLNNYRLSAYDENRHQGLVRHLVVRQGYHTGEIMVVLVVNADQLPQEEAISRDLVRTIPKLVSLVLNVNRKRTNTILGRTSRALYGQDYYTDQMLGLDFHISSQSFFQVNTPQAERLYQEAISRAKLTGKETVIDAYCGIGSISLNLARKAGRVYGMEIVDDAVAMARDNARLNGIDNAYFETGPAEEVLPAWQAQGIRPDVLVVDPPRKGLDPSFIETAIQLAPSRIVYVSCKPATLARDLKRFEGAGYRIRAVQPVDMFPQTVHVESVVLLTKKD